MATLMKPPNREQTKMSDPIEEMMKNITPEIMEEAKRQGRELDIRTRATMEQIRNYISFDEPAFVLTLIHKLFQESYNGLGACGDASGYRKAIVYDLMDMANHWVATQEKDHPQ